MRTGIQKGKTSRNIKGTSRAVLGGKNNSGHGHPTARNRGPGSDEGGGFLVVATSLFLDGVLVGLHEFPPLPHPAVTVLGRVLLKPCGVKLGVVLVYARVLGLACHRVLWWPSGQVILTPPPPCVK